MDFGKKNCNISLSKRPIIWFPELLSKLIRGFNAALLLSELIVKSVQSALSDLKRPPECLQSQRNYRPFITQQHRNGTLSETKLHSNLPKRNGQW